MFDIEAELKKLPKKPGVYIKMTRLFMLVRLLF